MFDSTSIGIAALGFLFGYLLGRIHSGAEAARIREEATATALRLARGDTMRAVRPEGGDHG